MGEWLEWLEWLSVVLTAKCADRWTGAGGTDEMDSDGLRGLRWTQIACCVGEGGLRCAVLEWTALEWTALDCGYW